MTPWVSAPVSARRRTGPPPEPHTRPWPSHVGRRSRDWPSRRNPSPAILRASARDLWGSRGRSPSSAPPGTREVWPRRVGWLSHLSVAQASPADASEAPLRAPPEAAGEALTSRPPDRRPTAETWESGESRFARWSRRGAWTSPMSSGPGRGRRSRRQRPREWRTPEAPAPGCRPTIGAVRRGWRFGPSGLPFTGSREHNRKHRGSRQDCPNA